MNSEPVKHRPRVGLALSGGGYRAAAFHLGTLRKLNQLGLLHKVDVLSTVSGGSIVGASYVLAKASGNFSYSTFEQSFIVKLKTSVIKSVITSGTFIAILVSALIWLGLIVYSEFTPYHGASWLIFAVGIALLLTHQFKIFPVSDIIERIYDRIFFNKQTLSSLPLRPEIAINSTNLATGLPFTFSKSKMSDSFYVYQQQPPVTFDNTNFPISRAVMASSCVPFAFTPVTIDHKYINGAIEKNKQPKLIDGGVYDNQGMHKLTFASSSYACDIIVASDAGDKIPFKSSYPNTFGLLVRTVDLFMNRIKKFQMVDNLYQSGHNIKKEIAFVSLGWDLDKCIDDFIVNLTKGNISDSLKKAHSITPSLQATPHILKVHLESIVGYANLFDQLQPSAALEDARNVVTNLTALSQYEISSLINQAELMTELQVKLYCPTVFVI